MTLESVLADGEDRMRRQLFGWVMKAGANDMPIGEFRDLAALATEIMLSVSQAAFKEGMANAPLVTNNDREDAAYAQGRDDAERDLTMTAKGAAKFLRSEGTFFGLPEAMIDRRAAPLVVHKGNIMELWDDGLKFLAGEEQ